MIKKIFPLTYKACSVMNRSGYRNNKLYKCCRVEFRKLYSSGAGMTKEHIDSLLTNKKSVPSIMQEEYVTRREKLMLSLAGDSKFARNVVILPGVGRRYMIDNIPYMFRQDTDMLYFSGCEEPDCVLVLHSIPDRSSEHHRSVMFTPHFNPSKVLWDGPKTIPSTASSTWAVDLGLPLTELEHYLDKLESDLKDCNIWYHMSKPVKSDIHQILLPFCTVSRKGWLQSPKAHIHELRAIKSPAEIALMRETCRISAESIKETMISCTSPISEHELFATVDFHCRMKGGSHLAYPPVVAGSSRANIIHYLDNNKIVYPGEMVLMDAGSEYKGYSGDITRTWPVDGKFTEAQRNLYEALLEVQKHLIQVCQERPGLDKLVSVMCAKLGSVLRDLGILPDDLNQHETARAAFGYCPHHVSHHLGMDVHDTALISKISPVCPGNVITIEPGIYISEKSLSVSPCYKGLGIRLEDDILITETGVEVLSSACPKEVNELEQIIGSNKMSMY